MMQRRVLFVLTSHSDLSGLRNTGFYLNEAAHPWKVLREAGYEVDFASVRGGQPPQDGRDETDEEQNAFLADPDVSTKLRDTKVASECDPSEYDAVFYVGGHGTMYDLPHDEGLAEFAGKIYDNGGVVAAVCHGPAGLLNIKTADGRYLVDGRRVTSFTNAEEDAVGLSKVMPFLLASELEDRGAEFVAAPNFTENVIVDGRLLTGQNPQSATKLGYALVEALDKI